MADGDQSISLNFGADGQGKPLASCAFSVPSSWTKLSGGDVGGRTLLLYADPENADTNAFALITPIRGDYTSLGSFGNLETVQATVMPPADDIDYEVIKAEASTGKYIYEYTIAVPDQPKRHLTTIFMVVADCIVTFNFQAKASDYTPAVGKLGAQIASTFKTGKPASA